MVAEPSSSPGPDLAWCTRRLDDIAELEPGWDDGAPVPSRVAIAKAREFLRLHLRGLLLPAIGPGLEGTVEFEWDLPGGLAAGMSFLPDGSFSYSAFNRDRVIDEGESSDMGTAEAFLRRFLSGTASRG
jgi:hypothetical protein